MAQNLRYKIIIDNLTDISHLFTGASIKNTVGTVPSLDLKLNNKLFAAENILPPTTTYKIDFSASTDGGTTWARLFTGLVEKYKVSLNASGERELTLDAYGGYTIRNTYLSPNQIGIGECDMGRLFTGSATSSNGESWQSDSLGNYPNGLLYDTSYSYGGVTDYFVSDSDVPRKFGFGSDKRIDIINSISKPYSAVWFIDDLSTPKKFYLYSSSQLRDFTPVAATFSVGTDINKYEFSKNLDAIKDNVVVLGENNLPASWYMYGSPGRELVVTDDDVSSLATARAEALFSYNSTREVCDEWQITLPPQTSSLLGKSVVINDGTKSWTRSVIGYSHRISLDRWTTDIEMERERITDAMTFAEVKEQLDNDEKEDYIGAAFLKASIGLGPYVPTYANTSYKWCAVGIGTSPADLADSVNGMAAPVKIVPFNEIGRLTEWTNLSAISVFSSKQIDHTASARGNPRIREIGLFATSIVYNRPDIYTTQHSFTLTRPTTDWYETDGEYDSKITTTLSEGIFPMEIIRATINSTNSAWLAYHHTPITAQRVVYLDTYSDWPNLRVLPLTSSWWSDNSTTPTPDQMTLMSVDDSYNDISKGVATLSGNGTGQGVFLTMQIEGAMDPSSPDNTSAYMKKLSLCIHAKAYTGSHINTDVDVYVYYARGGTPEWLWLGHVNGYGTFSVYPGVHSIASMSEIIDDEEKIHIGLAVNGVTGAAASTLEVQYLHAVQEWAAPDSGVSWSGDKIVVRKCALNEDDSFSFPETPKLIKGVYTASTFQNGTYSVAGQTNYITRWTDNQCVIEPDEEPGDFKLKKKKTKLKLAAPRPGTLINIGKKRDTIYKAIEKQGYAFIEYLADYRYDFDPIQEIPLDAFTKPTYIQYGQNKVYNLDIAKLSAWNTQISVEYSAVGPSTWSPVCFGRAVFTQSDTTNSCREGIDMDGQKDLRVLVEYDYNGQIQYTPRSASAHGGTVYKPPLLYS